MKISKKEKKDKYPSMGNRQTKPSESSIGTSGSIEPTRRSVGNDLIEGIIDRRSTSSVDGAPKLTSLSEMTRQSVPSSRSSAISDKFETSQIDYAERLQYTR